MPAKMLTNNERKTAVPPIPTSTEPEDELRKWARTHVERVRRLKLHLAALVLGMIVLKPIWERPAIGSRGSSTSLSSGVCSSRSPR